jgi:hypothetical protein
MKCRGRIHIQMENNYLNFSNEIFYKSEINMDPSLALRIPDQGYVSELRRRGKHSKWGKSDKFTLKSRESGAPYPTLSKEEKKRNIFSDISVAF